MTVRWKHKDFVSEKPHWKNRLWLWHVNYSKSGGMSNNWEQKSLEITETHSKSSLLSWIDIEQYFQLLDNIEIRNSMRTITLIYLLWVLCKIGRFSNTWMLKESRLCHSIDEPQFGRREWISGTFVCGTTTKYLPISLSAYLSRNLEFDVPSLDIDVTTTKAGNLGSFHKTGFITCLACAACVM